MTDNYPNTNMRHWFSCQMDKAFEDIFNDLKKSRESVDANLLLQETGTVIKISNDIAIVSGLPDVVFEERLKFPSGIYGIAVNSHDTEISVLLSGDYSKIKVGDDVKRTRRIRDMNVAKEISGTAKHLWSPELGGKT